MEYIQLNKPYSLYYENMNETCIITKIEGDVVHLMFSEDIYIPTNVSCVLKAENYIYGMIVKN